MDFLVVGSLVVGFLVVEVGVVGFLAVTERTGERGGEAEAGSGEGEEGWEEVAAEEELEEEVGFENENLRGEVAVTRGESPPPPSLPPSPQLLPFLPPPRLSQLNKGSGEERGRRCSQLGQEGGRVSGIPGIRGWVWPAIKLRLF